MTHLALTDLLASVLVFAVAGTMAVAYAVRVSTKGVVSFARVKAEGSSALLGSSAMNATHFALMPLGNALVRHGVSANAVTLASLVLGALSGVALGFGLFGIGAFLAAVSALGDALDGIVARQSGTASNSGETFDAAVDRYNEFFFIGGLCIFYRSSAGMLACLLLALLGSFMVSYATAKAEALQVTVPRGSMRRAERATYLTIGTALVPFFQVASRTLRCPALADLPLVLSVLLVAVVANYSAAMRFSRIARAASALAPVQAEAMEPRSAEQDSKIRRIQSLAR